MVAILRAERAKNLQHVTERNQLPNRDATPVGLRIQEAYPALPAPNPMSMELVRQRVAFRMLQRYVRVGLLVAFFTLLVTFLVALIGNVWLLGGLLWVLTTACVPLWVPTRKASPEGR
jgi:hypothetical protein